MRRFLAELPIEEISVCAWLLKDIAWAASFWPMAFPAAAASFMVESFGLLVISKNEPWWPLRMHRLGLLGWLTGNTLWMTSELLLEPREAYEIGLVFPWSSKPIIGLNGNETGYEFGQLAARSVLALVFIVEGSLCALQFGGVGLMHIMGLEQLSGEHRRQVYTTLFLVPWLLKDFLWTLDLLTPSVMCGCLTLGLLFDYYRRTGETLYIAMILWVSGNMAWIGAEVEYEDRLVSPRRLALVFLTVGFLIAVQCLAEALRSETQFREKGRDAEEARCLLAPSK